MTKEEILKAIDDEIAVTKDWIENILDYITATDEDIAKLRSVYKAEIKTLEWVKEMLEK